MSMREFTFPSANGRDTVWAWAYLPLGRPRAVVQLVHGFGEHSRRYFHMIQALLEAGYAVYADDHLGHGKTGYDIGRLGRPRSGGYMTYVLDEKQLHDIAARDWPDLPYFLFGHSWGSLLSRAYAAHFGADLTGLMLCGNCCQWRACDAVWADPAFRAARIADPEQPAGEWHGRVFCDMSLRATDPNNSSSWVSADPQVVEDHDNDMYNVTDCSLELVWDFVDLYQFANGPDWAAMVPALLPVYLLSGDLDPCGNYGEGLSHLATVLAGSGHRVTVRPYPGYRHEIQNEPAIRGDVEAGLVAFMDGVLAAQGET